jgi:hypothetical protein
MALMPPESMNMRRASTTQVNGLRCETVFNQVNQALAELRAARFEGAGVLMPRGSFRPPRRLPLATNSPR